MITREQSENIDLAEKGLKSPINPTNDGLNADPKDKNTVVENAKKKSTGSNLFDG